MQKKKKRERERDSRPWFLVWFILIGLWWSCYTKTLVPLLPLSVILSPLSRMYANVNQSNVMAYVNNFFTFFILVNYVSFLFVPHCIWLIFYLNCIRWCTFTFLTDFGDKTNAVEG